MITQITSEQIDQVINDGQFKYIKLTGSDNKEFGGWNRTPSDLEKKITSIKNHIKNLPSGQYFLIFKIKPGKDEWKYILTKGDNTLNQNSPMPMIIHQASQLEKFQTLEEWKNQEMKIKELEKELELLKMQNVFKDQMNEKPEENVIQGFASTILPQFVPLFDRFMSLQEKKLDLQQKTPIKQAMPSQFKPKPFRPAPSPDSELWESYIDYLDSMQDLRYDRELMYLKVKQPDVYAYVINETQETQENNEE
jgi:cell fate (sporulation/competence/biofilm development) regulator YmcA (YheA/YmcA/DUF963 family)